MKNKKFVREDFAKTLKYFSENKQSPEKSDYGLLLKKYREKSYLKDIDFFYDAVSAREEIINNSASKQPVVGYFCNAVPEELILACGASPVRLCSSDGRCAQLGEEAIPGEICPMVKSVCGDFYTGSNKDIDLLVIPSTCDGKVKLAEILSPAAEIYFIDIPRSTEYSENVSFWENEYRKFYEYMQKRYKTKPTRKDIVKQSQITNSRTEIFRKIYDARAKNPALLNAFDYFIMTYASFFLPLQEWISGAERIYKEMMSNANESEKGKVRKKILLAGSPVLFPNFKILDILDEIGFHVAAEVLCSGYGKMFDPVEIDEETESGIIRSLTMKYIGPSICPCFLGVDKLLSAIIDTVAEYKIDGVIYYNIRLCNVFEIQLSIIKSVLKERNIPFLFIKTDFGKEDTGQLKTRMEAFMEILG